MYGCNTTKLLVLVPIDICFRRTVVLCNKKRQSFGGLTFHFRFGCEDLDV